MRLLEDKLRAIGEVDLNRPLGTMTTYRIGGIAKYTVYPKDMLGLAECMRLLNEEKVPYKVIGKGSNLLCSDDPYDGVVVRLDRFFIDTYFEDDKVVCEAGASLIALSYECMKRGLSGLEFASGIPGTVGGAVFMNAGAYKSSMSEVIEEVLVLRDGRFDWVKNEECGFAYRSSVFQEHPEWLIVGVRLQLEKSDVDSIRSLIEERRARRMATQPLDYPSCGSVFRNPEGGFAWKYIDELGYRGKTVGGAKVSEKHSNFIINVDHAKASDVMSLIDSINHDMEERYGFVLKLEMEKFNWPNSKK